MQISLEANPNPDDVKRIHEGLDAYNRQQAHPHNWQPMTIFVRGENGDIKGGLLGSTFWNWCHIDILWLEESIRGGGYGSQLIQQAEQEAVARGCIGIFVDTMSFQAPDFYRKLGYTQWGRLDNFPVGHHRIFFQKLLAHTP